MGGGTQTSTWVVLTLDVRRTIGSSASTSPRTSLSLSAPLSPDLQISRSPDLQISSPCLAVADVVQAHGRHAPPSLTSPPTILQVCDRGWWGAAFLIVIAVRHAGKLQALA